MTPERLSQLIEKFASQRIAVLGDFFLDKYLDLDPKLAEVSLETSRTAHQVAALRRSPGAAGTVVNNLSSLGAGTLHAIGAIGDDGEAYDLIQALKLRRCETSSLLKFDSILTPTYLKPRDMTNPDLSGEHDRYDTKNRKRTPADVSAKVIAELDRVLPNIDAVILADQVEEDNCGVMTAAVRDAVAERAEKWPKVIFWADSRRRIQKYRNVVIKPNQFEAVGRENPQPGDEIDLPTIHQTLAALRKEIGGPVCITRGAKGIIVSDPTPTEVAGVRVEGPTDTTGAGDSVTAGCVLALASGATLPEAALVGMLVASITVQQLATTGTATPAQVTARLEVWRQQQGKR